MVAVEERAVGGHVIEDAVQDDAMPAVRGVLDQVLPILLRAEVGIDLVVVLGVVAVVGAGVEDRVEVEGVDAQRLE